MQKINREALKEAFKIDKDYNVFFTEEEQDFFMERCIAFHEEYGYDYRECINNAAAILLELTDPEFVPSDEMINGALDKLTFKDLYTDIFRAMIKDVVE